jgi:hypothetical protein
MKKLELEQMENLNAGKDAGCGFAVFGFGLALVGTFASFATLNPIGIALGASSIGVGFADMLIHCGEPVIQ